MVAIIVMTLTIILLVVLGIVFMNGKGSSLIAGFNTMSLEEKEKYDTVALCKFMSKMIFALSLSMLFWKLSETYDIDWLLIFGTALFIGIVLFMLIYVNTGDRFKE